MRTLRLGVFLAALSAWSGSAWSGSAWSVHPGIATARPQPGLETASTGDDAERASAFAADIAPALRRVRYLAQNCEPMPYRGYEGLPTEACTYTVTNRDGGSRTADVVLLNPDAARLAGWIESACRAVAALNDHCRRAVFDHVLSQSGGQFPVAGIVYEDILPQDGVYETYAFRDGVTVTLEGVPHRKTAPLTAEERAASIDPDTEIRRVLRFGRIASTTKEHYLAYMNAASLADGESWSDTVGREYRAAWQNSENVLITAWASANRQALGAPAAPLSNPDIANGRTGQAGLLRRTGDGWAPVRFSAEELRAPGRLCIRYKNYWCIKSAGWNGETGRDERNHAIFSEPKYGARAFFVLMRNYRVRHDLTTTRGIFGRYAPFDDCVGSLPRDGNGVCPQGENPTFLYATKVAGALGLSIDDDIGMIGADGVTIDREMAHAVARAVLTFELGSGYDVTDGLLDEGIALSGLTPID